MAYHLTVPEALLSAIAKILEAVKLRAGAATRRACGADCLRKAERPRRVAAGLKLIREFMNLTPKVLWTGVALQSDMPNSAAEGDHHFAGLAMIPKLVAGSVFRSSIRQTSTPAMIHRHAS